MFALVSSHSTLKAHSSMNFVTVVTEFKIEYKKSKEAANPLHNPVNHSATHRAIFFNLNSTRGKQEYDLIK